MPVTESIGYTGDVDETDWAQFAGAMGSRYSVVSGLTPSISTTLARGVRITPGTAIGCGVIDNAASATDVQLPVVNAGSRWFLIVLKRVWGTTKASTLTFVDAPQTGPTLPTRATEPGIEDDQPIALARVKSGETQVQEVRDLRVWSTSGGAVANDELVLDYLRSPGTRVTIGSRMFTLMHGSGAPFWLKSDLSRLETMPWAGIAGPTVATFAGVGNAFEGAGWSTTGMNSVAYLRGNDVELHLKLRNNKAGAQFNVDGDGIFTGLPRIFDFNQAFRPGRIISLDVLYRAGSELLLPGKAMVDTAGRITLRGGIRNRPLLSVLDEAVLHIDATYTAPSLGGGQ